MFYASLLLFNVNFHIENQISREFLNKYAEYTPEMCGGYQTQNVITINKWGIGALFVEWHSHDYY